MIYISDDFFYLYSIYFSINLLTEPLDNKIKIIPNESLINNITSKINVIYKQIKKNEIKPDTDYLFNNSITNNNLENIQILTIRQNVSKTIKKTSSKYTGVSFEKSRNKWVAMIYVNGLHKKIGRFDNEYDAHLAYENELSKII